MHIHNCRCFQDHLRMLLQSLKKKRRNCDGRAICNALLGIDAGRGVIPHRGVSDGPDRAHPLWRSHSAQTEKSFADVGSTDGFVGLFYGNPEHRVPIAQQWIRSTECWRQGMFLSAPEDVVVVETPSQRCLQRVWGREMCRSLHRNLR